MKYPYRYEVSPVTRVTWVTDTAERHTAHLRLAVLELRSTSTAVVCSGASVLCSCVSGYRAAARPGPFTPRVQNADVAPVSSHYVSRRRAEDALELRALAYSWQEIADRLGYRSRSAAHTAVVRLLASTRRPTVAESRVESAEQLRVMRRRLFDHLEVADRDGDADTATKVAREIRANLDSAAKLDGLNAPQRTDVEVTVHRSPGELIDAVRAELAAVAATRGHQPRQLDRVIDAEIVPLPTEENTA